jgi:GPH family glycoside/pentoside/hexuronide:cation symporter
VNEERAHAAAERRLDTTAKLIYGTGDHSVNLSLSALSILFAFFLTDVAGLRPGLAGLVVLTSRIFDAISDPLVGRFSDTRRWSIGRRRPFFLIGMVPFSICFALLWRTPFDPDSSQFAMFCYYTMVYMALSITTTTLSVPYLALIPEMARDYEERTSVNAFRSGAAVTGSLFAIGMRQLADSWGGDANAYAAASSVFAIWLMVPWLPVFLVSFERPGPAAQSMSIVTSFRETARHKNFMILCALYIAARIGVDIGAASLPYYAAHWLHRPGDLQWMMLFLLGSSVLSLPIWLRIGRRIDKQTMFIAGAAIWGTLMCGLFFIPPDFPRGLLFALTALSGFGYCAADLAPWAMIGETIDEAELRTGTRHEGLYNGFFMFLRKIAGASGVALMLFIFDLAGYSKDGAQNEDALLAIRAATGLIPASVLVIAILIARRFPITRAAHAKIRAALDERASRPAGEP